MPKVSEMNLLEKNEQPTLCIRTRTRVENLPALIGQSYGKLGAYFGRLGRHPADVPYVAYHNMDMQDLDVEMGFPVAEALPGDGEIVSGRIPAGKSVFCMYRGAYGEMAPVYQEMAAWIAQNGLIPTGHGLRVLL